MKNEYVIKGTVNNREVYYVETKEEDFYNIDVQVFSAVIGGATKFNSIEDAEDVAQRLYAFKGKIYPICPSCGCEYDEPPAISRYDSNVKVCSKCGVKEALEIFIKYKEKDYIK